MMTMINKLPFPYASKLEKICPDFYFANQKKSYVKFLV